MSTSESVVYVVDDDQRILRYLKKLISTVGLSVKTFETAREFLEVGQPEFPGCLLVDVRMPGMSGLDLQKKMLADGIDFPVIIMTGHADVDMVIRAMKDGAFDFLRKPFDVQALLDCVQKAVNRSRGDFERRMEKTKAKEPLARLTSREREVLDLIVAGKPNRRIAQILEISISTVEYHRANTMKKMEARSVADLVRMLLAAGKTL